MASLDELENHPVFYERDFINVNLVNYLQADIEPVQNTETYLLKRFKPELLGLEYLENWTDQGLRPYVPGHQRPEGSLSARTEVMP